MDTDTVTPVDNPNPARDAATPGGNGHLSPARCVALRYGVSLRTAYRHVRRGTLPASLDAKRTGRDGKRYPPNPRARAPTSKVVRDLALAMQALRRVDRTVHVDGIRDREKVCLSEVAALAGDLWGQVRTWIFPAPALDAASPSRALSESDVAAVSAEIQGDATPTLWFTPGLVVNVPSEFIVPVTMGGLEVVRFFVTVTDQDARVTGKDYTAIPVSENTEM